MRKLPAALFVLMGPLLVATAFSEKSVYEPATVYESGLGGAELLAELGDPANPTFGLLTEAPIAGLELVQRCVADDMPTSGSGNWTCSGSAGATLTGTGAATPVKDGYRLLPATTYAGNNGNAWRAANPAATDTPLGVRDFVVLAHVRLPASGTGMVVSAQHSGDPGWEMSISSNGSVICLYRGPTVGIVNDIRTTGVDENAWFMPACIFDRDGYLGAWGTQYGSGSGTDISAGAADTIDSSTYAFTIGASPANDTPLNTDISWVDIWACPVDTPDCLTLSSNARDYDTELQAARDRVFGQTAIAYGGAEVTTSIASRNTSAYARICDVDKDEMVLELIGNHTMRTELGCGQDWEDHTGSTLYRGFIHEQTATNAFSAKEDLTDVAWTKTNVTVVANASCGGTLFAHDSTCQDVRASSTSNVTHSIAQAGPNTAEEDHAFQAWQAGAVDYLQLHASATNWVTFDLTTCDEVEQGSGVDFVADYEFRNGWCWIGFSGDAAIGAVTAYPCNTAAASAGCSYAAADTTSAQVRFRTAFATANVNEEHGYYSPEPPAGTRGEDEMEFALGLPAGAHTIVLDASDMRNDSIVDFSVLSDNDADVHAISKSQLEYRSYGDVATVRVMNISTATPFPVGGHHYFRSSWAADNAESFIDGVSVGTDTDTSGEAPGAYGFLYFGKTNDNADRHHGTIWNIRVYAGAHAPGEAGTGTDVP